MIPRHVAQREAQRRAPSVRGVVAILALTLPLADVAAQQPATASLGGIIVEAGSGRPLGGASVTILGVAGGETTDAEGRFLLFDVPSGRQRLLISYRGHELPARVIELEPGRHTAVRISLALPATLEPREEDVVALPPLDVDVEGSRPPGKLRPFYRRRDAGRGAFITHAEILERDPRQMSDMLREVPGVRVSGSSSFGPGIRTARGCGFQMFIDGLPAPGFRLDDMPPQDIAGIEIYIGASQTPVEFRRAGECGALVIWTRDPADPT